MLRIDFLKISKLYSNSGKRILRWDLILVLIADFWWERYSSSLAITLIVFGIEELALLIISGFLTPNTAIAKASFLSVLEELLEK